MRERGVWNLLKTRGGMGVGVGRCVSVYVVEAAGWRVCKSRQGQTGNDEVIAKARERRRKAEWLEGGRESRGE